MMHPDAELRFVSPTIGYGVFATKPIPKGTITYVVDRLEIKVSDKEFNNFPDLLKAHTRKYSYVDGKGTRIISWDLAKYVNHCCDCNSMSTGYGFEIAIRDIAEGEQITDEYGLFNIPTDIEVVCDKPSCRCVLRPSDIDEYGAQWDERIRSALDVFRAVEQPLAVLLDDEAKSQLESYFVDPANYRSVAELKRKVF